MVSLRRLLRVSDRSVREVTPSDDEIGPEAVRQLNSPTWHLIDLVDDFFTICGMAIHYGAPRRAWVETPEVDRCHLCRTRLLTIASKLPSNR